MLKRKSKGLCLILILLLAVGLLGCADKWQTQYDLGVKYLSEGNYEEAVIAFTAAIEIDEKKPEAYISLAEVYQAQEDWENALAALQQGQESCGESEELTAAREELEQILSQQGLVIEENGQIGWAVDPDELMQQLPGELQDYFYLTSAQREERLRPLIPLLQERAAQDDKGSGESWANRLCDVYYVLGETEQLQQLRAELLEITDARDKEYAYGPEGGERVDENGGRVTTERTDGSGNMVYYESVSSKEDGSSSSSIIEYEYGGDGRRERSTENSEDYYGGYRANGTTSHEKARVMTYEYDGEGRLTAVTQEDNSIEVTRNVTSTSTFIERSEYSYGDGVVTVNSHIENSHSSGSSDSWDSEETFEINEYGRKL